MQAMSAEDAKDRQEKAPFQESFTLNLSTRDPNLAYTAGNHPAFT
jgi:hypothetical protein